MDKQVLSHFEEDMQLRGFAPSTQEAYKMHVRKFAEFIGKPLPKTGPADPKRYLLYLRGNLGRSVSTQNQCAAALRFLYLVTLDKSWAHDRIPFARVPKRLPDVLSGSEVVRLMRAFESPKHKTLAMVCYGAGTPTASPSPTPG